MKESQAKQSIDVVQFKISFCELLDEKFWKSSSFVLSITIDGTWQTKIGVVTIRNSKSYMSFTLYVFVEP
jgi:hypothetical protein